jgi:hypothetical protein
MAVTNILRDPLIRRFVSGSLFAGVFIFVAVRYYNVETEIVWTFLLLSCLFVVAMIGVGLLLMPLITLTRRKPSGMLDSAEPITPPDNQPNEGSDPRP